MSEETVNKLQDWRSLPLVICPADTKDERKSRKRSIGSEETEPSSTSRLSLARSPKVRRIKGCPHWKHGCLFEGSIEEIDKHLKTCAFDQLKHYIYKKEFEINKLKHTVEDLRTETDHVKRVLGFLLSTIQSSGYSSPVPSTPSASCQYQSPSTPLPPLALSDPAAVVSVPPPLTQHDQMTYLKNRLSRKTSEELFRTDLHLLPTDKGPEPTSWLHSLPESIRESTRIRRQALLQVKFNRPIEIYVLLSDIHDHRKLLANGIEYLGYSLINSPTSQLQLEDEHINEGQRSLPNGDSIRALCVHNGAIVLASSTRIARSELLMYNFADDTRSMLVEPSGCFVVSTSQLSCSSECSSALSCSSECSSALSCSSESSSALSCSSESSSALSCSSESSSALSCSSESSSALSCFLSPRAAVFDFTRSSSGVMSSMSSFDCLSTHSASPIQSSSTDALDSLVTTNLFNDTTYARPQRSVSSTLDHLSAPISNIMLTNFRILNASPSYCLVSNQYYLVSGHRKHFKVWNMMCDLHSDVIVGGAEPVRVLAVDNKHRIFSVQESSNRIKVWQIQCESSESIDVEYRGALEGGGLEIVSLIPYRNLLLSAEAHSLIKVWNTDSFSSCLLRPELSTLCIPLPRTSSPISSRLDHTDAACRIMAMCIVRHRLCVGLYNGSLYLLDLLPMLDCSIQIEQVPISVIRGHGGNICSLAETHNKLIVGYSNGSVKLWDVVKFKCTHTVTPQFSPIRSLAIIPLSLIHSESNSNIDKDNISSTNQEIESNVLLSGCVDGKIHLYFLPESIQSEE